MSILKLTPHKNLYYGMAICLLSACSAPDHSVVHNLRVNISDVDDNGNHTQYTILYHQLGKGAGDDDKYGTSDDDIYIYTKKTTYSDLESSVLENVSSGPDGLWFTEDDKPQRKTDLKIENGFHVREIMDYQNINFRVNSGVERHFIADLDGDEFEITRAEPGIDRKWNTIDDVILGYRTTSEVNGDIIRCNYNKGEDDLWFTTDDSLERCVVDKFNNQGNIDRTLSYHNFGEDNLFQQSDQVFDQTVYNYDNTGSLISSKYVYAAESVDWSISVAFHTLTNEGNLQGKTIGISNSNISFVIEEFDRNTKMIIKQKEFWFFTVSNRFQSLDTEIYNDTMLAELLPSDTQILSELGFNVENSKPQRSSEFYSGIDENNGYSWIKEIREDSSGETTIITDIIIDKVSG